jgi:hypothetical protein
MWDFGLLGAAGSASGAYDLIASTILTSTASSVTFSNLGDYASTYKHLQVRYVAKATVDGSNNLQLKLNGSSTGYKWHALLGSSSTVSSGTQTTTPSIRLQRLSDLGTSNSFTNTFTGGIIDFLDCYSTTKNKTTRALHGLQDNDLGIHLSSGLWADTASITSLEFTTASGSFGSRTRFSLYGIKG